MKKPISFRTVGFDLFWIQLTWTFIAMGIFLAIKMVQLFFSSELDGFYSEGYIASNLYMLVIGIIAISFLSYYVGLGITRRTYFLGNVLASMGLSILIPIMLYVISLIEKFIVNQFTSLQFKDINLENIVSEIDIDSNHIGQWIGDTIQSIILTPFVHPESNLVLSLALFSLHIFVFYMMGWMIGAAFNRLGVIGGIFFIVIGILLISIKDSMLRLALDTPLFHSFSVLDAVPEFLALPLVFVVSLIPILFIYLFTKRAPIKI